MSSNCPPQLQLSLQPSTTSFKRSFEQFGFDLESPQAATDAGGSGANNGNDRNKRARSASSFSEGSDSMDSSHLSTIASGSSGSSPSRHGVGPAVNESTTSSISLQGASMSTHSSLEPPRLPTPDIQDIEMPDYPVDRRNSESFADSLAPQVPDPEDRYRLSLDRYNPFHTEMPVLRQSQSNSPLVPRSSTPGPPILPPLYISEDQSRLSTSSIPFLHPPAQSRSITSHAGSFFDNESPSSIRAESPSTHRDNSIYEEQGQGQEHESLFQNEFQATGDPITFSIPSNRRQSLSNITSSSRLERRAVPPSRHLLSTSNPAHFREHLNSALDHLRSPSPLVPGLEDVGDEASLPHSVNNRISRALPNPPTLPPIVTDADSDNWNENSPLDIFAPHVSSGPSRDTFASPMTTFDSRTSASSSGNINLGDHPLPSPGLHDLHSWMDASSSSHAWDASQLPTSSTEDSRQNSSHVARYQGTLSTSSAGQNRASHDYSASIPRQLTSSSPTGLTSPPLRNWRFTRVSDPESNRREWSSTSTSASNSTSTSQSDSDSQSDPNASLIGLPPLSFHRRSADETPVRSLDQGFDSRLSFSARPLPPPRRSLSYAERRQRETQLAEVAAATRGRARGSNANISELLEQITDETDAGDRGLTNIQINDTAGFAAPSRPTFSTATLERLRASRGNFSGLLGRAAAELDAGSNGSDGPSLTSQSTSTVRYPESNSESINSPTVETRTGNISSGDLYFRHRLRAQMARPGASNSLVNESAVEARRRADRMEVLERMNEAGREDWRNNGGRAGGRVGDLPDSLDSHIRNVEANLRENGMSSVGWDPTPLNRRPHGPTNDLEVREDSQRLQEWTPSHWTWRQPPNMNHRLSYLSLPQQNILPLPGLPSNDDMDMMIGESIGFRPTDFTPGSASSNNTRNNQILPSSLYDDPGSSRTASRPSDYFWLTTSRPASSNQNNMDTGVSPELPSSVPETDIFSSRYRTAISDMASAIAGTSSSNGGGQRRHSASSDSSHSDGVLETQSNQPYLTDPPSLPPPDLGGVFDAERHASSIAISHESPETIFVHPPQRPLRDASGMSQTNPPFIDRPPSSIPIQDNANSTAANVRISYTDIRQRHQSLLTSELDALIQRQRRSQFEARRISALAEEIRGIVESSSSNPATNSTTTQAQSAADLRRSSALGQSYRNTTIEPTERRNHTRSVPSTASETPSTRYQGLDPSSFTPGPFRNTVQQLFNERRHTQRRPSPSPSVPPTIPPLSFEDNGLSSLHQRILLHQLRRPTETAETTSVSNRDMVDDSLRHEREDRLRREQQTMNRRMADRLSAVRGTSLLNENTRRREQLDMHRYLTQQARIDASRLDDSETPPSAPRSGGDIQGLSYAIDVLRHDGLSTVRSQQLIERFRRERESARTRPVGSEPESTPVATSIPAGPRRQEGRRLLRESIMRREPGRTGDEERRSAFSSAPAQHVNQEEQRESEELVALGLTHSMRGRRGRFPRVPADVLYSFGRQARRGGTFGDYVRDEDFDETYEGLLSLSATLGDVKPKSTPASIISKLETGQYKDWATSESDQRCPICLDDYQPTDQVLKLNNCSHWLHKDCLQQWLQGASTCPVCRKSVHTTMQASTSSRRTHPRHSHLHYPFGGPNPSWRRDHPPPPPPPGGGGVLDPV